MVAPDHKVRINISGHIFETYICILENFPNTLLGNKKRRQKYWDKSHKEFFFDASPQAFEAIFQFYQTGYLMRPSEVPLETFLEQLKAFEMDTETMKKFHGQEGLMKLDIKIPGNGDCRSQLWGMFENPNESRASRILSMISIASITFSVVLLCLETVPSIAVPVCKKEAFFEENGHIGYRNKPNFRNEFFLLENCIIIWFAVEFMLRVICCPTLLEFVKNMANVFDALAIFPHLMFLIIVAATKDCNYLSAGEFLTVLRILRLFRVFKFTRYNTSLQLILHAFKESFHYLLACFYVIMVSALLFAFLLYWIEMDNVMSEFKSIEEGLWWAFGSMTTVGYGDIVPQSRSGRAVGCVCIVIGFIIISLPAAIIVTNFNRYYRNITGRGINDSEMNRM